MARKRFERLLIRQHQQLIMEADLAEATAAGRLGQMKFDKRKAKLNQQHGGYPDPEERLGFWTRELAILARATDDCLHCSAS